MPTRHKALLIVDDDDGMRETLTAILEDERRILVADSAEHALETLDTTPVDLMLLDVRLPGMSGLELLRRTKRDRPEIEIIMISVVTEIDTAVQAMREGAYYYITKDFEYETVRTLVANASEKQDLTRRVNVLRDQVTPGSAKLVTGPSPTMQHVLAEVHKVAPLNCTVLLQGESGTGKEVIARHIHDQSQRASGPFIVVNMAAIPGDLLEATLFGFERGAFTGAIARQTGKFELAEGGTLFLDEIGDMPLELQTRLLRTIQDGEVQPLGGRIAFRVDCRLIAATHLDLGEAVKVKRFREDLYYRLNVIPITLPPLRERREEISALLDHFLDEFNRRHRKRIKGFSHDAVRVLQRCPWRGNVRELQNLVERLVVLQDIAYITTDCLPIEYQLPDPKMDTNGTPSRSFTEAVTEFERSLIADALRRAQGNVTAASRILRMPLSTLKYKLERFQLRALGHHSLPTEDH